MADFKLFASGASHIHEPGIGIACLIAGGFFITMNDAAIKAASPGMPVGEIMFLRAVVQTALVILYLLVFRKFRELRVEHRRGQAVRAAVMVFASFMFVWALRLLPLADATALLFLAPLMMTAFGPLFLGEKVGWHCWLAVCVGFAGTLVMLRPTEEGIQWAAMLAIGAATGSALRDTITRHISADDSTIATLFYTSVAILMVAALALPFGWKTPEPADYAILGLAGLLQFSAHFLMIEAFRYVQISAVAPFKYIVLIWAAGAGYWFFGEIPDTFTVLGALLIIAAGLYVIHRNRLRGHPLEAEGSLRSH